MVEAVERGQNCKGRVGVGFSKCKAASKTQ